MGKTETNERKIEVRCASLIICAEQATSCSGVLPSGVLVVGTRTDITQVGTKEYALLGKCLMILCTMERILKNMLHS